MQHIICRGQRAEDLLKPQFCKQKIANKIREYIENNLSGQMAVLHKVTSNYSFVQFDMLKTSNKKYIACVLVYVRLCMFLYCLGFLLLSLAHCVLMYVVCRLSFNSKQLQLIVTYYVQSNYIAVTA